MMKKLRQFAALVAVMGSFSTATLSAQDATTSTRRSPQAQIRYSVGPDSKPQEGVPKGRLEGPFLFQSKIIEDTIRQYWIFVPAQYDPEKEACVLIFQDGARATNPTGSLQVPQALENLIAKNQIPVTIGIFITPGQRGDDFPDTIGTGNPDNRDREYDILGDQYARFILEEMLPEVGKKYNLTDDPAGRAIGGSSSGAICAFTVAWERPDQFRNVISMIGSFTNIHGGHVYPEMILAADKKPIRIFLQDGLNDNRSPNNLERDWYLQNQKMKAAFEEKGYDMAFVLGEGGHADDHGGSILPQMLRWIWRDYPGVEAPTTDLVAEAAAIKPVSQDLFPGFDADATVDVVGTYAWEQRFGNNAIANTINITMTDGSLAGTLETKRGDQDSVTAELTDVVLQGNKLIFDVSTTGGRGGPRTTTYQAVVSDSGLSGWQMNTFRGQNRDRRWNADRAAN